MEFSQRVVVSHNGTGLSQTKSSSHVDRKKRNKDLETGECGGCELQEWVKV